MTFKLNIPILRAGLLLLIFMCQQTYASVIVNGTRVIYHGEEREVTVKLSNKGKGPVLVQSWIDNGKLDAHPEDIKVPFILTPPINRINPDKSQTLRISFTGTPALPEDRESVYWLNVLEIPPVAENANPNHLQVAFRTRIKIFYRPSSISDRSKVTEAAEKIKWSIEGKNLKATNNSPYYISLIDVNLSTGKQKVSLDGEMIPPFENKNFQLKDFVSINAGTKISWDYINDWGAVKTVNASL